MSKFIGSYMVKLVDSDLTDVGVQDSPITIKLSQPQDVGIISGVIPTTGDHIIVPGVTGARIKVYALSVFAPSSANLVTVAFTDGIGGPTIYKLLVEAPNLSVYSFNADVSYPTFLFSTSPDKGLNLNMDALNQLVFNISYFVI